jgi:hypothetical protein
MFEFIEKRYPVIQMFKVILLNITKFGPKQEMEMLQNGREYYEAQTGNCLCAKLPKRPSQRSRRR